MKTKRGSTKPGPSRAYVRLLEGKITSKQYANTVKRSSTANKSVKRG